jgi:RNA polymerase sigma-70 factor (ECF subfamily)
MASLDSRPTATSTSLIARVKERDAAAWSRLARIYSPLIYRWARQCGLQASDAADAVQEVFLAVSKNVAAFDHAGPSATFRGWLWTITRNQVRLFHRKRKGREQALGGTDANIALHQHADLLEQDGEPAGFDSRRSVVHRALEVVRADFNATTWHAFLRVCLQGESAVDVAADLGMTPAAVRQAKYRVLCRLHDEVGLG